MEEYKWKCAICKKRNIEKDNSKESHRVWRGEWIHDLNLLICPTCFETRYPKLRKIYDNLYSKTKKDYFIEHVQRDADDIQFIHWIKTYINWIFAEKSNCGLYQCYNRESNLNEWLIRQINHYIFLRVIDNNIAECNLCHNLCIPDFKRCAVYDKPIEETMLNENRNKNCKCFPSLFKVSNYSFEKMREILKDIKRGK